MNNPMHSPACPGRRAFGAGRCPAFTLTAVLMAVLLGGCRKEEANDPPQVTILQPFDNTSIQVPDTLAVRATLLDAQELAGVTIQLLNDNGIPVVPSVSLAISGTSFDLQRAFPVIDEGLASGPYTLAVRATDGNEQGSDFRTINVSAAPLRLRAVFAVHAAQGGAVPVTRIDSVFQAAPFGTFPGDLSQAVLASGPRLLYLAGAQNAPLRAIDLQNGNERWSAPNQNTLGTAFFTALHQGDDGRIYHATNEGLIRGASSSGVNAFTAESLAQYRTTFLHLQDDQVVAGQEQIAGPQQRLVTYTRSGGALLDQFVLDKDLVHADRLAMNEVLLFGNRNGEGVVEQRNIDSGAWWEPRTFSQGEIRAVARQDGNTWFVALPGELVRFTYSNAGAITVSGGVDLDALAYDAANGLLWGASGNEVLWMDPASGAVLGSVPVQDEVLFLLPFFNR
ncbi:MAG: hypothetical protein KDC02_14205 [Flavobacteriales bacterium]|nr:hypothetical protein [Flavobacteriales bacterium]